MFYLELKSTKVNWLVLRHLKSFVTMICLFRWVNGISDYYSNQLTDFKPSSPIIRNTYYVIRPI